MERVVTRNDQTGRFLHQPFAFQANNPCNLAQWSSAIAMPSRNTRSRRA
jgi:hypothetical protein